MNEILYDSIGKITNVLNRQLDLIIKLNKSVKALKEANKKLADRIELINLNQIYLRSKSLDIIELCKQFAEFIMALRL